MFQIKRTLYWCFNCESKCRWCVAYVKQITSNGYIVDHLHQAVQRCNNKWKYPTIEYIQIAETDQIVNCIIDTEWDYITDRWTRYYLVENIKAIEKVAYEHVT